MYNIKNGMSETVIKARNISKLYRLGEVGIGKALEISHRTVEIYRARLMRKYNASTAADLVHKLLAGQ